MYKYSDKSSDFIYKKDIKAILKTNKIKINDIDLIRTIEGLYGCQYYADTRINQERFCKIFKHITNI